MTKFISVAILFFMCLVFQPNSGKAQIKNHKLWAQTPPMGWNSYNSFGAAVQEKEVKANAEYMAAKMKNLGWEYIVIEYCWS